MIQQRAFIIISCLLACFFVSCNDSDNGDKVNITVEDSVNTTIKDSGLTATETDVFESIKTDSISLTTETIHSLSEVNKRLNKKGSYFVIRTNRDTVIKCKEGTLLSIPANAFLNTSNQRPVIGEVRISVKEFYKISDMMIQGLTTTSNNKLLETGGMINIKVTNKENNDSCILNPGKNIVIAMANSDTSNVDRMQLFNGAHDSGSMTWEPQAGVGGFAQRWQFGRNNSYQNQFPLNANLVFPDKIVKVKPVLISSNPENLKAEIKVSIRELVQHVGTITKKANGYIDTSGNLHCYKIGSYHQEISFIQMYTPTMLENIKVNLPVDVNLSFKSNLNYDYYQKLFKMGKGNPDSLVNITATLNPSIKITCYEKLQGVYKSALGLKEYQKKQKRRAALMKEYEKKIKQLRLDDEDKLARSEQNATNNLRSAQNYLLLSTSKLGWINCDRFYNYSTKVDYIVKLKERASVLIVFNSLKSIMSSDENGIFQSVPLNEKITIVGLKAENGKLFMAYHETIVTDRPFEALSFVPVTVKEYKNTLEKLNRL